MARCAPHRRVRFGLYSDSQCFPQPLAKSLCQAATGFSLKQLRLCTRALACRARAQCTSSTNARALTSSAPGCLSLPREP
eukprot:4600406-Alexandrium_andersonii.AAC.1